MDFLNSLQDNLGAITAVLTGIAGVITAVYQYVKNHENNELEKGDRQLEGAMQLMDRLQKDNAELHDRLADQMRQLEEQDRLISTLRTLVRRLQDDLDTARRKCIDNGHTKQQLA